MPEDAVKGAGVWLAFGYCDSDNGQGARLTIAITQAECAANWSAKPRRTVAVEVPVLSCDIAKHPHPTPVTVASTVDLISHRSRPELIWRRRVS